MAPKGSKMANEASNKTASGESDLLKLTGDIVAAYLAHNALPQADVVSVIKTVHTTLAGLTPGGAELPTSQKPAVPIKKSVTADYVVCLEDGKKLKMLKRYLRTRYGLSPDDYRHKWGLPIDYPMVAPNYAATRSAFAKKIGLGRTPKSAKKRKRG
jgi:predicted transcriptional regulator